MFAKSSIRSEVMKALDARIAKGEKRFAAGKQAIQREAATKEFQLREEIVRSLIGTDNAND